MHGQEAKNECWCSELTGFFPLFTHPGIPGHGTVTLVFRVGFPPQLNLSGTTPALSGGDSFVS